VSSGCCTCRNHQLLFRDAYKARRVPVPSFYFDLHLLANYWGCLDEPRTYHHTAPIQSVYGLRAALSVLVTETIDASVRRHATNAAALWRGLEERGLHPFVNDVRVRNTAVTTVAVPDEWRERWKAVVEYIMRE
jgi:alanine-glyoxylate transaminase/serine-glyoxylate transaminase/serine-pyruvate transaminase